MKWNPIETAPKDGTDILIVCMGAKVPGADIAHWDMETGEFVGCGKELMEELGVSGLDVGTYERATHWMPLPPPPEAA